METVQAAVLFAALSVAALLLELVLGLQAFRSPTPWSRARLRRIVLSTTLGGVRAHSPRQSPLLLKCH